MGRPLLPHQRGYLAPPPPSSVATADELFKSRPASAAAASISKNPADRKYDSISSRSGLNTNSVESSPKWDNGALGVHLGAITRSPMKAAASLRPMTPAAAPSAPLVSRPGTATANSRPGTSSGLKNPTSKMSAEAQLRDDMQRRPSTSSSSSSSSKVRAPSSTSEAAAAAEGRSNTSSNRPGTKGSSSSNRLVILLSPQAERRVGPKRHSQPRLRPDGSSE